MDRAERGEASGRQTGDRERPVGFPLEGMREDCGGPQAALRGRRNACPLPHAFACERREGRREGPATPDKAAGRRYPSSDAHLTPRAYVPGRLTADG